MWNNSQLLKQQIALRSIYIILRLEFIILGTIWKYTFINSKGKSIIIKVLHFRHILEAFNFSTDF